MFDWSNRVIGYQDPDYAVSSFATAAAAGRTGLAPSTEMAQRALALAAPHPAPAGACPTPAPGRVMPDLYAYANALGDYKRRNPGDDVMSNLMTHVDAEGGRVASTSSRTCSGCSPWPATKRCATASPAGWWR